MVQYKELKKNLKRDLSGFPEVKISLVGDTATQLLATAIRGMGVERGYRVNLFEAEYNQVERQFMDPTSELYDFDADMIVVFQSTHKLGAADWFGRRAFVVCRLHLRESCFGKQKDCLFQLSGDRGYGIWQLCKQSRIVISLSASKIEF